MKFKTSLKDLFRTFHLEKIKVGAGNIASAEITFVNQDKDAAWDLYVEMLTRIVTRPLPDDVGVEKTALESVYSLFPITRDILHRRGRRTVRFSKVAIPILNQLVRPFTTKWHQEADKGAFGFEDKRSEFRRELRELQKDLCNYSNMLAKIAEVEDLNDAQLEYEGEYNK